MLTRDFYVATLEKRAAEEGGFVDNQEAALQEYASNTKDNKAYVAGLFDNTGAAEKANSREAGKLFPGKSDKESGYMFMKVARAAFDEAMASPEAQGLMKAASSAYREVAFHSFCEELEKISALAPSTAMHQAFKAKAPSATPTWHIPDPDAGTSAARLLAPGESAGLSPAVKAMRAKAAKPGLLSRAIGALGFGK